MAELKDEHFYVQTKNRAKLYLDDLHKSYEKWFSDIIEYNPDIIIFESTTPIMKFMWKITKDIKSKLVNCTIVMTGYHSMRKPEETINN